MADPKGKAKKAPVEGASAGRKSAASKVSAASSGQSTPKGRAKPTPVPAAREKAPPKTTAAAGKKATPVKPVPAAPARTVAPPRNAKPAPAAPAPPSVPTPAARLAAATAELDPVAAMVGETISKERELELRRAARRQSAPPSRRGLLYDTRFLVGLFVVAMAIFAFGIWQLVSDALTGSVGPGGGALLPGDGVSLPGGPVLPILVVGLVSYFAAQRLRRPPRPTHKPKLPGKGWRWAYDSRVISSAVAPVLVFYGFSQLAPPGSTVHLRDLPGEVNNAIQAAVAQPESGFPRIKISSVNIDLLVTKGDGKTPPVKYEAFTYPGADHLLTGDQNGGSNTYLYAHARTGMF